MMAISDGFQIMGGYEATELTTSGDTALVQAELDKLVALIPDPDNTQTEAPHAGSYFDMMPPIVAAQLRKELAALRAVFSDAE